MDTENPNELDELVQAFKRTLAYYDNSPTMVSKRHQAIRGIVLSTKIIGCLRRSCASFYKTLDDNEGITNED